MLRSRTWLAYLAAVGLLVVGWCLLPGDGAAQQCTYILVGASSVLAVLVGTSRMPRRRRLPWLLLAAGQACAVLGDAMWTYLDVALGVDPFPSVADASYLAEYPLLCASILVLVRQRCGGRDREGFLDSAIVSVGLGLLVWVTLIRPQLDGSPLTSELAVGLAYPAADILLLANLSRLLTAGGVRSPSYRLLVLGTALLLLGDTLFTLLGDEFDGDYAGFVGSMPFLLSYAAWGAAALHPSAANLGERDTGRGAGFTSRRLAAMTAASLVAPAVLAVELALDLRLDGWAVAGTSAVLFLLVVRRMSGLLRVLQEQSERLDALARTDALTGLPNRRSADAQILRAQERTRGTGHPLLLALLDLDHFKAFNDTFGHQAGDRLLVGCASAWTAALPDRASLARYGGEEFVLLLPEFLATEAEALLQVLRIATPQGQSFSAGLAAWDRTESGEALLHRADLALYAAKGAGRDRTEVAVPA